MRQLIKKFHKAIDDGLLNDVFNHVRNFFYAAVFLAAGSYTMRTNEGELLFGLVLTEEFGFESVGILIVAIGVLLMLANLYSGIYRLSKRGYSMVLRVFLAMIYVFISVRIVEVMWDFREKF
jgi:hypothetical protein